jgi:Putative ParB-like nuclease
LQSVVNHPESALAPAQSQLQLDKLKEVDHEHYSRAPTSLRSDQRITPDPNHSWHAQGRTKTEGVKDVLVTVLENLSGLTAEAFWSVLDNRSLIHPYDAEGHRQTYEAIPRSART